MEYKGFTAVITMIRRPHGKWAWSYTLNGRVFVSQECGPRAESVAIAEVADDVRFQVDDLIAKGEKPQEL